VHHRVLRPVLLQRRHCQPVEQLLLPLEIRLHSRHQQTLSEPPGAAQEVVLTGLGNLVDEIGLVDIDIPALADLLKTLYSNRVKHTACPFSSLLAKIGTFLDMDT